MNEQPNRPTELESRNVILFNDCDPLGHLNNARYLHYFFNAREQQVGDAYDMHFSDVPAQFGKTWVVRNTRIAYLTPALLREEVLIRTRLIDVRKNGIVVEALMLDKDARRLKCLSWVEFACIDLKSGRPTAHPEVWQELVDSVRYREYTYAPADFDDRVLAVAREIKRAARSATQKETDSEQKVA